MGLLDGLLGNLAGELARNPAVAGALAELVGGKGGGLNGLVQSFARNGLGDVVNSWVGTGRNMPISPEQILRGLGPDKLGSLASQFGVDAGSLSNDLANMLPEVVDKLTPGGVLPADDIAGRGLDMFKDLAG